MSWTGGLLKIIGVGYWTIATVMLTASVDFIPDQDRLRYDGTRERLAHVLTALERYRAAKGSYPARLGELDTSETPEALSDYWNQPFGYRAGNPPEVYSYGADGKPGGELFASDMYRNHLAPVEGRSAREREIDQARMIYNVLVLGGAVGVPAVWLGLWLRRPLESRAA